MKTEQNIFSNFVVTTSLSYLVFFEFARLYLKVMTSDIMQTSVSKSVPKYFVHKYKEKSF